MMNEGVLMVRRYRGIRIDTVAECHQNDGRREWLSCTEIGTECMVLFGLSKNELRGVVLDR